MQITNIHNAKTNLSKYLKMVSDGEEVIICSSNKPIAKLIAYEPCSTPRIPGKLKGKICLRNDFNALPEEFLKFFK